MSKTKCRCNGHTKHLSITCGGSNCQAYTEYELEDCKVTQTYTWKLPNGKVLKNNGYHHDELVKELEEELKKLNSRK
jgi:predicted transcriptional regulator of viral defense system